MTMRTIILAGVLLATSAQADERFYGPDGRPTGSMSRDSSGAAHFRDAAGRGTGSCSTDSGGAVTCYDAGGRVTGRASGLPRR